MDLTGQLKNIVTSNRVIYAFKMEMFQFYKNYNVVSVIYLKTLNKRKE